MFGFLHPATFLLAGALLPSGNVIASFWDEYADSAVNIWNSSNTKQKLPASSLLVIPAWHAQGHAKLRLPESWSEANSTTELRYSEDVAPLAGYINASLNFPPLSFKGRYQEDRIALEQLFFNTSNGLMVEVGANDGSLFSSSFIFDKYSGWRTVIVEGDPVIAAQSPLRRPNAISVNLMVCENFKTVHFSSMGTMGGVVESMSDEFAANWHSSITSNSRIDENKLIEEKIPIVGCAPLGWVLEELGLTQIDFLTIDLVGGELPALLSIDLNKIKVNVILISTVKRYFIPQHREIVLGHLKSYGYKEWTPDSSTGSRVCWKDVDPFHKELTWALHPSFIPSSIKVHTGTR